MGRREREREKEKKEEREFLGRSRKQEYEIAKGKGRLTFFPNKVIRECDLIQKSHWTKSDPINNPVKIVQ